MQINRDDDFLFEHLSMIIQAYEEAALQSNTRVGIAVVANSSILAMDQVLETSSKALTMNKTKKISKSSNQDNPFIVVTPSTAPTDTDGFLPTVPNLPTVTLNTELVESSTKKNIINGDDALIDLSSIELDDDLKNITGASNLQDFLKDCIGCDLRLTFDWQLKPIDLLGPIQELIKDINLSLDSFETQLDPFTGLENLCDILNNTNWLCLPDLVSILMSLKMLFKSYLTFQLSINLDWTVILGPLLKVILDAVASLIQAIASILLGPLDCTVGALKTIAEVEKQLQQAAEVGLQVVQRIGDRAQQVGGKPLDTQTQITTNALFKDVAVKPGAPGSITSDHEQRVLELTAPTPPSLQVQTRKDNQPEANWSEWSFPSGVALNDKVRLPEALKDPRFDLSHWTTKLILVIQEAKQYILDLVRKIIGSANSLKGLVSGGLSVHLGNLGLLLFVKDMIALVLLIIKLLSSNRDVKDWCSHLENHPEILEEALGSTHGKVVVTTDNRTLILSQGPKVVGTIKTCTMDTSSPQQQMLNQWISELKRGNA